MTNRFVIFSTPSGGYVMVNAAHVVVADNDAIVGDSTMCRLWLTTECWTVGLDGRPADGQRWIDVNGDLETVKKSLDS